MNTNTDFFVVLDTNIWVYQTFLLRSPLGASLLHALINRPGSIALPEIVWREVVKHTKKMGANACQKATDALSDLALLTGIQRPASLPTADQLEAAAEKRLEELRSFITPIEISPAHFQGALNRLMDETAPNGERNQQYKDSLVWEAVLELAKLRPVHFVSRDGGFFDRRAKGDRKFLAPELAAEVKKLSADVTVHNDLESLLNALHRSVPAFKPVDFVLAIEEATHEAAFEYASQNGLTLGQATECSESHRIAAYITEVPGRLAVSFSLFRPVSVASSAGGSQIDQFLIVAGTCFVDVVSRRIGEVKLESISLEYSNGDRVPEFSRIVFVSARTRNSEIVPLRYPIELQ